MGNWRGLGWTVNHEVYAEGAIRNSRGHCIYGGKSFNAFSVVFSLSLLVRVSYFKKLPKAGRQVVILWIFQGLRRF